MHVFQKFKHFKLDMEGSELFTKIVRLFEGRWELRNQGSVLKKVCLKSHSAFDVHERAVSRRVD